MTSIAYTILILLIGFMFGLLCAALMFMAKGRDDETS